MSFENSRESLDTPVTPKSAGVLPSNDIPQTPSMSTAGELGGTTQGDARGRLDKVLQSNIGVNTLLTRLKQSISSAKEFSVYLKERAILEEKHANGLKKLTRSTQELVRRPENRQGSFATSYEEMTRIQDRMADNGMEFAQNLHMMAEELQELATTSERGRKQWKHTGLDAEQRATDAEAAMEKAKSRYFSFADQYDRARTGERQGGKFGLKGPKTAAQQEEALLTKVQNADAEYSDRVQAARGQRHELFTSSRPQAVRELQNCIMECDAGLGMQLQKFALLNEKLLLHNGLSVSPLKNQTEGSSMGPRSLRDLAHGVNNQRDFEDYVLSHTSHVGATPAEIQYEKHPAMMPSTQQSQPVGQQAPPSTASIMGALDKRDVRNQDGDSETLNRRDTNASINGPVSPADSPFRGPQSQTSGLGGIHGPPHIPTSTAPQLPQIGGLSVGGRSSLDSGARNSSTNFGSDMDHRDFSGPQQHRPQQSYSGPTNTSQYNSGPAPQRDPYNMGTVLERGQFGTGNPPYTIGHSHSPSSNAPQYSPNGRNQSLGRSGDFGSGGFGPDGPGLTSGQNYRPPHIEGRHIQPETLYQTQEPETRGATSIGGYSNQAAGRGMPPQTGYQAPPSGGGMLPQSSYQSLQDGRGMPSMTGHQGQQSGGGMLPQSSYQSLQDGRGVSSQNGNHRAPGNNFGPSTTVASAPSIPSTRGSTGRSNLPPLKPVFGVSLDDLFRRDGGAVPPIVYQCVQAVDLYGLNTEGIYRTSGSAQHITELRALFDHDSSQVDFRDRSAFHNDIAAVTTLLKHFLRDLKDPLLTSAQYNAFIQAAKIDDDIIRRDSLHAIINSLPDPNYATLRTLVLHLNRVSRHSMQNRMTANNLAIIFGPTLMVGQTGATASEEFHDSGYQARVVETILNNTYQIFDDDD